MSLRTEDMRKVASRYGINTAGLSHDELADALEDAGQCGAWEVVQSVLHGMDYPVRMPPKLK